MKFKWLLKTRNLHIVSLVGILMIYIVAAVSSIENDTAYLNLFENKIEIGHCFYREHYGIECPSCGLTRSFVSIQHLHILESTQYNKFGFLVYILTILVLILNVMGILELKSSKMFSNFVAVYGVAIAILLLLLWIYRVVVLKDIYVGC